MLETIGVAWFSGLPWDLMDEGVVLGVGLLDGVGSGTPSMWKTSAR